MEAHTTVFLQLPNEVLIDLLFLLDTKSVFQFYATNTTHRKIFNQKDGLWQGLARKVHLWSAADARQLENNDVPGASIDWKKEYLVGSFFDLKIRGAELTHNNVKPLPTLLKTLAKNHFLVESVDMSECGTDFAYCALQSLEPLYPLPIGNFTIAYYEIEVLKIGDFDLAVGAAQDGYVGYVGIGRDSYAFASDVTNAIIYLSSEFVSDELPTHPLHVGDIIGFGINFSNRTIFWTKNGEIIYETKKDAIENPIRNIKSLHATVSMDNHELKANFGERPFEFNILAYQKKNTSEDWDALTLYHETILSHFCSFMDSESFEVNPESNEKSGRFYPLASDRNPPKFRAEISPLAYMLAYCRNDPESKYSAQDEVYIQMETCRALLSAAQRLHDLKEPSKSTAKYLQTLAMMFEIPNYDEKSWQEKVLVVLDLSSRHIANLVGQFIHLTIDSTADFAFRFQNWATNVMCLHQLVFNDEPTVQRQAAMNELRHQQQVDENFPEMALIEASFETVLRMRTPTIEIVSRRRCIEIRKQKINEYAQLSKLYGEDKLLKMGYETMLMELDDLINGLPDFVAKNMDSIYLFANMSLRNSPGALGQRVSDMCILCGVYRYHIEPAQYPSTEKYLDEVEKRVIDEITPELLDEYLQYCKYLAKNIPKDEFFQSAVAALKFYGVDLGVLHDVADLRNSVMNWNKPLKKPSLVTGISKSNTKLATRTSNLSTGVTVGLIAGLAIGIGLGVLFLRKKFNK